MENKKTPGKKGEAKSKKSGRGGARAGAGRKPKFGPSKQVSIDTPQIMLQAIQDAGITNKTTYFVSVVARDLINNQRITAKQRTEIVKIADATEDQYFSNQ